VTVYWSTHEREGVQTAGGTLEQPDTQQIVTAPKGVRYAFVAVEGAVLPDEALAYVALAQQTD
jgi:hypothetical protein